MNEIQTNNFDYSVLDSSTAEYLKDRENSMSKTLENAAEKLGEDLYKAQHKLAKNGYGQFEEWYTSLGLKKRSVYNYIDRYSFVQNLHKQEEIEVFQELTPSLKNEMSKPSADPEVNQKVFDGDITTHKEYKRVEREKREAEQKAKEYELQLEQAHRSEEILQSKLEDAENKEPEIIERYSEPDDYEDIKNMNDHLEKEREYYKNIADEFRKEIENLNISSGNHEPEITKGYEENNSYNSTNLIALLVSQIEEIIGNDSMDFDRQKVKEYFSKLIKRMDE